MLAHDILHTIGNTPHIRINRLFGGTHAVYVKSERSNPGGSIKDRIALSMVESAEASGALRPGSTIGEPTSPQILASPRASGTVASRWPVPRDPMFSSSPASVSTTSPFQAWQWQASSDAASIEQARPPFMSDTPRP